jgi:hypothetical protein
MTDRELLELAAKAAGLRLDQLGGRVVRREADGQPVYWNPITDDADALRLAVKLRIGIGDRETTITAFHRKDMSSGGLYVEEVGDPYAATRRAIVRAAAEIGRGMP